MSELFYNQIYRDWYYSFLEIENLNLLVNELIDLQKSDVKRYYINKHYVNILAEDIGSRAPVLTQYLKTAGLDKKFQRLLYSAYYEEAQAVHVDSYDPKYCSVSLNIPLTDCENSYTAWYHTDKDRLHNIKTTGRDPGKHGQTVGQHFAYLPLDEVTEICRAEVTRPMLVNTTILHRGIVPTLNRTICGIRFSSELTNEEVLSLGIKQPFVQID